MTDFTLTTDADGVATITWDVAGKVDERDVDWRPSPSLTR